MKLTPPVEAADDQAVEEEGEAEPAVPPNPFRTRVPIGDFAPDTEWVNTGGPLRLQDLRGRFVLIDFWTYCCINCMHILPELEKLEEAYPENLTVIGVHSAKFDAEQDTENIRDAILRYGIRHPVINDADFAIWNRFGARSWPTIVLIDPEGQAVYLHSGEIKFEDIDAILQRALPYYRDQGLLVEAPLQLDVLTPAQAVQPLRYPGKVLADADSDRLFIADTGHNRIVVTSLAGDLQQVIGQGAVGFDDGALGEATFHEPNGMALDGDVLYVADTGNHAIRRIDLNAGSVETIAGTGEQMGVAWPGDGRAPPPPPWRGPARETDLASPWALYLNGDDLFIAMAGRHQLWKLELAEGMVGIYAGNGREDIVDGPLLPTQRYEAGYASFAQPSGLTSDGQWLYVADSEGSSIRAVPLDGTGEVRTLVGTEFLPFNRLFEFGDVDGPPRTARFQHCLGVAWHGGTIFVADTYNDKLRTVEASTGEVSTPELYAAPGEEQAVAAWGKLFDEPEGLSYAAGRLYVADTNHHRIAVVDLSAGNTVSTLPIQGLRPPAKSSQGRLPDFSDAEIKQLDPVRVRAAAGELKVAVELDLPPGWKINPLAPMGYVLQAEDAAGPLEGAGLNELVRLEEPAEAFEISLPLGDSQPQDLRLSLRYYYCQEGAEGLCRVGAVVWQVPLEFGSQGAPELRLEHAAPAF